MGILFLWDIMAIIFKLQVCNYLINLKKYSKKRKKTQTKTVTVIPLNSSTDSKCYTVPIQTVTQASSVKVPYLPTIDIFFDKGIRKSNYFQ